MDARSHGGVALAVVLVVCGLAMSVSVAFTAPPENEGALAGGKVSVEEKARIAALAEQELVDLTKTGTRGQAEAAVKELLAKGKGDTLLATAKAGPRLASEVIIELYVPKATSDDDAKAKEAVDAYLTWLEEQLKAESPVVRPEKAVRSLGRVASLRMMGIRSLPTKPRAAAPYQHERVVGDLVALLKDKRVLVRDEATSWLAIVGGYTAEEAEEATTALKAYRQAVAAEAASNKTERDRQAMRLGWIDRAIKDVQRERAVRVKFGVETTVPDPHVEVTDKQPPSAGTP